MNHYEKRQEQRRERYEARAEKARQESGRLAGESRSMGDAIPLGQPLLVDHHSYKRDLKYRERMHNKMRQSVEADKKAAYYERRAASVGTGGISSDDPDALVKLREELAAREQAHETMKAANKRVRKNDRAGLIELGFTPEKADELLAGDFMGRRGFPNYAIQNSNANLARLRKRIKELEAREDAEDREIEAEGYTYREDTAENRVMFLFDGKPPAEVRAVLKRHKFRWSPSREGQPWVRQLTNAGIYAGQQVRKELAALEDGTDSH